jgi:hypothetical protein
MLKFKTSGPLDFGRAIWAEWFSAMSGPLSVPAAIFALWVESPTAKVLLGLTALFCASAAAYSVWKRERDCVISRELEVQTREQEIVRLTARAPTLNGKILHYTGGGEFSQLPDEFPVILTVEITNTGELPSVAKDWQMIANIVGNNTYEGRLVKPPANITLSFEKTSRPNKKVTFYEKNWIVKNAASTPISSGSMLQGFIIGFFAQTIRTKIAGSTIGLQFADVRGTVTVCETKIAEEMGPNVAFSMMEMGITDGQNK